MCKQLIQIISNGDHPKSDTEIHTPHPDLSLICNMGQHITVHRNLHNFLILITQCFILIHIHTLTALKSFGNFQYTQC